MGIVKFEVEIPEFNNELTITLTIKKDGEVIQKASLPPSKPIEKKKPEPIKKNTIQPGGISGNMMDLNI